MKKYSNFLFSKRNIFLFFFCFTFFFTNVFADVMTPIGDWKTFDERDNSENSTIKIWQEGDSLSGKIAKINMKKGQNPKDICKHCKGERKDQPILGMTIIWGMKPTHNPMKWDGGNILDPRDGKIYRASLTLIEGGKALKVRGYIGISLLGRTVIWKRAAA